MMVLEVIGLLALVFIIVGSLSGNDEIKIKATEHRVAMAKLIVQYVEESPVLKQIIITDREIRSVVTIGHSVFVGRKISKRDINNLVIARITANGCKRDLTKKQWLCPR